MKEMKKDHFKEKSMSMNRLPTKRDGLLFQQSAQQHAARKTGGSSPQPIGMSPVPAGQDLQAHSVLKMLFTLLLIICVYCLGSFSLAPHLLASSFFSNQLSSSSPPSTGAVAVEGGKCDAVPTDLHYLPSVPGAVPNGTSSPVWFQAGYSKEDFASASACAASFLISYFSFDFRQAQTFVACTSLLSAGGQQRFYGRASNRPANIHIDPFWRASIQQQQLHQSAQVSSPTLLRAQFNNQRMFAWMQVHYQLTIYRNDEVLGDDDDMTVLVVSVPSQKQTAWQVSDWRNGSEIFNLATPF
jgi:hypothetical protein